MCRGTTFPTQCVLVVGSPCQRTGALNEEAVFHVAFSFLFNFGPETPQAKVDNLNAQMKVPTYIKLNKALEIENLQGGLTPKPLNRTETLLTCGGACTDAPGADGPVGTTFTFRILDIWVLGFRFSLLRRFVFKAMPVL